MRPRRRCDAGCPEATRLMSASAVPARPSRPGRPGQPLRPQASRGRGITSTSHAGLLPPPMSPTRRVREASSDRSTPVTPRRSFAARTCGPPRWRWMMRPAGPGQRPRQRPRQAGLHQGRRPAGQDPPRAARPGQGARRVRDPGRSPGPACEEGPATGPVTAPGGVTTYRTAMVNRVPNIDRHLSLPRAWAMGVPKSCG